jgi:hypothetical protein
VRGRTATAAVALEDDARILLRISCEIEKMIDTNRKYMIKALSAEIAAAQDFVSAFKALSAAISMSFEGDRKPVEGWGRI